MIYVSENIFTIYLNLSWFASRHLKRNSFLEGELGVSTSYDLCDY